MKHKFSSMGRVAIALVLALSLSLVMAAPVAADTPADTDVGFELGIGSGDTAEWSDEQALPAGGDYSVKLYENDSGGIVYIEVAAPSGITLDELSDTQDWGFSYFQLTGTNNWGPQLELQFTEDGTINFVDVTFMLQTAITVGEWITVGDLTDQSFHALNIYDGTYNASYDNDHPPAWTLATAMTALVAGTALELADLADYDLTRIRVQLYPPAEVGERTVYIDDIIIDGTTYELEPIFLDAEYYSVGDTVEVTVPNFAANTDSFRINPVADEIPAIPAADSWTVSVNSDSDPGTDIIVALEETGADTGVFTASFGTSGTTPVAEDEVYVEDGATITVKYTTSDLFWGAGDPTLPTSIEVLVDDTVPTIDVVLPEDGTTEADATPEIKASYSDVGAGIDTTSVEMFVDDVEVTDDATVTASSVTYTPEDDLAEGSHDVIVNVSDNAGNAALTKSWSFRIASWLEGSPVVDPTPADGSLDALETVGVAVSGATGAGLIEVGRYASNPQPEAPPAFDMIEDGFFDVKVTGAGDATQIVIKFADTAITAESTAYVWDDLQGMWLACSDQGYNPTDEFLWVKVRVADTTPNISELSGTPFAISGEPPIPDISAYYRGLGDDAEVVETTDLLTAANDWADEVIPSGFTESILTTELLALANEWAATE